jgi:hypothetical protein
VCRSAIGASLATFEGRAELGELRDVEATEEEGHRADAGEVELEAALVESGWDHVDEVDVGTGELGQDATGIWRAASVDDKESTAGEDQRAIAAIRRVDALADLAQWAFRPLGRRRERKDRDHAFVSAEPVTDDVQNLLSLLRVAWCGHDADLLRASRTGV